MSDFPLAKTLLVGISGASGSGKSFFAHKLQTLLAPLSSIILSQDDYYQDLAMLSLHQREKVNFDHPDAVDFELLVHHLHFLRSGRQIEHPLYDFSCHTRRIETASAGPADVVLVDGILIFCHPACRDIFDYRIYIDTPLDICFIRRLHRDITERERTIDSVTQQYLQTVRPMFWQFVQPASRAADMIITDDAIFDDQILCVRDHILKILE